MEGKGYNKAVDVYAFGVMLWEIFTGEIPFHRYDVPEIRQRVCSGKRPAIPSYGLSPRLVRLINSCWDQNPEDRPTFTNIVDELYELEKEIPEARYSDVSCQPNSVLDKNLQIEITFRSFHRMSRIPSVIYWMVL